ncbi:HNH endonuclease [Algoriphagus lutimaris]|uniref:HNH endonuclease n=1 Tax=Algoriphagus lutimaris TaxID=613197 RepID=UPI00196B72DC|nr:HNH endonuclease signature motif containing protein [Algoriphagus lutimaris]MBN3519322.1 HNH endonuclease [Algoriphagus lutimaris]
MFITTLKVSSFKRLGIGVIRGLGVIWKEDEYKFCLQTFNLNKMAIKSRLQLFKDLSVHPKNPYWAWCAKNESIKRAIFTVWEDLELPDKTWFLHEDNSTFQRRNGFKDQKETIDLAIQENYEIFGIICVAKDPYLDPRTIKEVEGDFVYKLEFIEKSDQIYVKAKKRVPTVEIMRNDQRKLSGYSGLQDLDTTSLGTDNPDRTKSMGYIIKRDNNVRKAVINRANGKCEYCGKETFVTLSGKNYLEAHHIISLAQKGTDRMDNVIALCSEHHREAHFGVNSEALEKEFIEILENKKM